MKPRHRSADAGSSLTGRAAASGGWLIARHALVSGVNLGATVLLAAWLGPTEVGAFGLTLPWVGAAFLLLDLGTAAALVREPGSRLVRSAGAVFWAQTGVGLLLLAPFGALATFWAESYALPVGAESVLLMHALALIALPGRHVAVALLERSLRFREVARIEAAEAVVGQGLAVWMAWRGHGALALAAAPVARAVTGAVLGWGSTRFAPGPPRLDLPVLRRLLAFGVPLQSAAAVNLVRAASIQVVVGSFAGSAAVGCIYWATSIANYPALLLMTVSRMFYPWFTRVGKNRIALGGAVSTAMALSVWGAGLCAVPLSALGEPLVRLAGWSHWAEAAPLFAWFAPVNVFLALIVPAMAWAAAAGRPGLRLGWAAAAGVVLWAGAWLLVPRWGMFGWAAANLAMNLVEIGLVAAAAGALRRTLVPWRTIGAAALCGVVLYAAAGRFPDLHWPGLIGLTAAGMAGFVVLAGLPKFREARAS